VKNVFVKKKGNFYVFQKKIRPPQYFPPSISFLPPFGGIGGRKVFLRKKGVFFFEIFIFETV
jgi:hypothetical protein